MSNIKKTLAPQLALLLFFADPALAQGAEQSECSNRTSSSHYQQSYQSDELFIFYDLTGENAIADQTDKNNNAIPDIIEDTMLQLITMRDVLDGLGFKHPFEQYRYERAGVERINVGIRNLNGNGIAFDPPHRDTSVPEQPCVLLIGLSNELTTGNLTPAHELFHLYQYGYSVFKNRWYLEGVARWSEGLLGERSYVAAELPTTPKQQASLLSESYDTISFWMGFLNTLSPSTLGERNYSEELLAQRYVGGEHVIHDSASTHGAAAMINVLESFDKLDRQISQELDRKPKSWSNDERSNTENNAPMLNTVFRLISDSESNR